MPPRGALLRRRALRVLRPAAGQPATACTRGYTVQRGGRGVVGRRGASAAAGRCARWTAGRPGRPRAGRSAAGRSAACSRRRRGWAAESETACVPTRSTASTGGLRRRARLVRVSTPRAPSPSLDTQRLDLPDRADVGAVQHPQRRRARAANSAASPSDDELGVVEPAQPATSSSAPATASAQPDRVTIGSHADALLRHRHRRQHLGRAGPPRFDPAARPPGAGSSGAARTYGTTALTSSAVTNARPRVAANAWAACASDDRTARADPEPQLGQRPGRRG